MMLVERKRDVELFFSPMDVAALDNSAIGAIHGLLAYNPSVCTGNTVV